MSPLIPEPPQVPAAEAVDSVWRGVPKIPVGILGVLLVMAIFAPVLAPHDPEEANLRESLIPPVGFSVEQPTPDGIVEVSGTWRHPLGTDSVGRDLLSRVIFGSRYSLAVAFIAMAIGAVLGTVVGLVSGYAGGLLDVILMRLVDVFFSFPVILLALLLTVVRGPGFANVVIAMSFVLWTRFARVVRGEAMALRTRDFVAQAQVNGLTRISIITRHILPNVVPTLIVLVSLQLGWAILIEASLSFLGAGLPPTLPAWGVMIDSGQRVLREAWWVAMVPGVAILLVVLSFNVLGDWMRDTFDPHLAHE